MITIILIVVIVAIVFWFIGFCCGTEKIGSWDSPRWDYDILRAEKQRLEYENYRLMERERWYHPMYYYPVPNYSRFLAEKDKEEIIKLMRKAVVPLEELRKILEL